MRRSVPADGVLRPVARLLWVHESSAENGDWSASEGKKPFRILAISEA